jgi:hypothetical protein
MNKKWFSLIEILISVFLILMFVISLLIMEQLDSNKEAIDKCLKTEFNTTYKVEAVEFDYWDVWWFWTKKFNICNAAVSKFWQRSMWILFEYTAWDIKKL